jgi:N-acetylneuraminate synthase
MKIGKFDFTCSEDVYFCAEIGINHNGSIDLAKELINIADRTGCNGVKFQKRNPRVAVPEKQKDVPKDTPWGTMSYLQYREKVEFSQAQMEELRDYAVERDLDWFVSCWDLDSIQEMVELAPAALKIPSALITNKELVTFTLDQGLPIIWSTGMSTVEEVQQCYKWMNEVSNIMCHCNSSYPAEISELNLSYIGKMKSIFKNSIIGYSGHETSLLPTVVAVVQGADYIERHITKDRALWGTDQAASVEEPGLKKLIRDIRLIGTILGKPEKVLFDSELSSRKKLRGTN